ncbi:MAG TPA: 5-formyltetrahydrofolate cyclo-ligase [Candidatus Limiplasma sp.]|nr:5-formyltetrahydrofolate cyclo-ligase [Candidatus Limiplasma sp.]HRX08997.1 5-formyltetrahydrofolate cyclo-ligase [Candidatus Limiplasma sp.]
MDERIRLEKQKLRQALRALADALPQAYLTRSDRAIEARLLSLNAWKRAKRVFIYVSMGREPDTRGLLQAALAEGKTLAVPLTFADGIMEARVIRSLSDLKPGRMGILEPTDSAPLLPPDEIDLIVVPCIAADRQGYRLGYGGGYYDRYLANTRFTKACLCREQLLQAALPHDAYDIPMTMVITESDIMLSR